MRIHADSDAMAQASATIRSTIGAIESDVNGLLHQLMALQSSWTGSASDAFQALIQEWRRTQRQVEESLENINRALAMAGEGYRETERSNADLFRIR